MNYSQEIEKIENSFENILRNSSIINTRAANTYACFNKLLTLAKKMQESKTYAYWERNQLVRALSKLFPSSLERHVGEDWEDDWRWIVFIDLPNGQACWHIHDDELKYFMHLEKEFGRKWDGHSNEIKYCRLEALKKDPWIPCSEREPDKGAFEQYQVTCMGPENKPFIAFRYWEYDHWDSFASPVIAWRQLPEPWRGEV